MHPRARLTKSTLCRIYVLPQGSASRRPWIFGVLVDGLTTLARWMGLSSDPQPQPVGRETLPTAEPDPDLHHPLPHPPSTPRLLERQPVRAGRVFDFSSSDSAHGTGLPILRAKLQFLEVLQENQTLIVAGEGGVGKSTQIPQVTLNTHKETDPSGNQPPSIPLMRFSRSKLVPLHTQTTHNVNAVHPRGERRRPPGDDARMYADAAGRDLTRRTAGRRTAGRDPGPGGRLRGALR